MRALVLLALCSCAAPFKFTPATPDAVAARRIGRELGSCLRSANGWNEWVAACYANARQQCRDEGLPASCGSTELFWTREDNWQRRAHDPRLP